MLGKVPHPTAPRRPVNAPVSAQTSRAPPGSYVLQFSVFLEAKCGRLLALARLFESAGVHILGLSVVDATEASLVRLVVDDPGASAGLLEEACVPYSRSDLVVAELTDIARGTSGIFAALHSAEVSVYHAYPLLGRPNGRPLLALCVEDNDVAAEALQRQGIRVLRQADLSR